jgi:ribulose-5-phosphate 4-epimerase/fuculose-1-phosphate aldolase
MATSQPIAADSALIDDLVIANRILYNEGVVDGFGHISVRHDKAPERFLLARSMAPGLVTAADIMQFDRDGEPIDPQSRTPYLERFIHSEIYKLRPEVQAIVHSHSPAVIPFGVVAGAGLQPIYHMSSSSAPACRCSRSVRPAGRRPTC